MAAPMNISIPPLKPGERIEEWQPLFVAATSALAAHAGDKAVIQILPSYVCRDEFEKDTTLLAIKEETIEAAFKVLSNALDAPIDEFDATSRFRSMVWARGTRIEVFFTRLWKEAKRAGFLNQQVCITLVTQLPGKACSSVKKWVRERVVVTDEQMREFIGFVQQNLRQADVLLDFGSREAPEEKTVGQCKVVTEEAKEDQQSNDSDADPVTPHVWKVRQYGTERRAERGYRGASRDYWQITCFTCGRRGHGYQRCPDRICKGCHGKGHDVEDCTTEWRGNIGRRGRKFIRKDFVKELRVGNQVDERAASIVVRIGDSDIRALLDTGAKVNVMDVQTMRELGLTNRLRPVTGQVYGVGGAPVTVVGKMDVPIRVSNEEAHWTRVHVLEGEEQALLLGRQFLKSFGRVTFDWDEGLLYWVRSRLIYRNRQLEGTHWPEHAR
ncbi:Transposon Ty3-G Gag-Pol polyprotein [Oopsacas minuta]|uniref:Transposon Ty3-G Gag-Pol polyprotein n=1 Tax=Oopsacas minuta TaxID=111878 RepID=A0AAV7JM52_9METZ|nr:Transposon Ty3-G Gag-Pol polyprotein [Oopsacas minuta]